MKIAVHCGPNDVWYENFHNGTVKWMGQGKINQSWTLKRLGKEMVVELLWLAESAWDLEVMSSIPADKLILNLKGSRQTKIRVQKNYDASLIYIEQIFKALYVRPKGSYAAACLVEGWLQFVIVI